MNATKSETARTVGKDVPSIQALAKIAFNTLGQYPYDQASARHRATADAMKRFELTGADTYHQILTAVFALEQEAARTAEEARQTESAHTRRIPTARSRNGTAGKPAGLGFVARIHDALQAAEAAAPVITTFPTPRLEEPQPQPKQSPDGQLWLL